jgi:hypothetical protein
MASFDHELHRTPDSRHGTHRPGRQAQSQSRQLILSSFSILEHESI